MPNFQAPHMPITHMELHPLRNLVSLCSCTQEVTCGSDTVKLLEQMLLLFWKKVLVCCPFWDSCLGYKFEDMSLKGRGKSLLACRHGALWQFWHPSVLSCDQSMDLCTHSGAPASVETPGACSLFMPLSIISESKGFLFHFTDCFHITKCVLLCPLQLHYLKEKCPCEPYIHLK